MSIKLGILTIDDNITLDEAMNLDMIVVDSSSIAITVTLDATPMDGSIYYIKDTGNASVNNITIDGNGINIDNAGTKVLNTNYEYLEVVYCQSNNKWFIIT